MVAARIGSERLREKNLLMVGDAPVVAHAIRAARGAGVFHRVVLNADSDRFADIARAEGVEFYHRPAGLGASDVLFDDVIADFMERHPCDVVTVVNTPSVLQSAEEVASVVRSFLERDLDSLITTQPLWQHALLGGEPVNFSKEGKFARTQDLEPVRMLVYSIMMWRRAVFLDQYRRTGHGIVCGRFGTVDASREASVILKTDLDLQIIRAIHAARQATRAPAPPTEG
jgi:CMP-N-acetylneuraminic acid synthetase